MSAQVVRTNKPWIKAKLMPSNGQNVLADAETGPYGIDRQSYMGLKSSGGTARLAAAE